MTISITEASALRRKLVLLGYTAIVPLFGKIPAPTKWQQIADVTANWIAMWQRTWPSACNTGVLTKFCPTIDIDIFDEPAAIACEEFVRERFEEHGFVMVRIGQPPKRAIMFRTNDPFSKITVNFISERGEKIELLAAGQQVVVHGIHPSTQRPYYWHGGEPWSVAREDLPYVRAEQAQELVADVVNILITEFNYQPTGGLRSTSNGFAGIPGKVSGEERWRMLIDNILHGRSLHDSINSLASMLVVAGMQPGAAVHLIAALLEQADIPHDQRWESRYRDIPRAIDSARKFR
jgi:hypothetical protein